MSCGAGLQPGVGGKVAALRCPLQLATAACCPCRHAERRLSVRSHGRRADGIEVRQCAAGCRLMPASLCCATLLFVAAPPSAGCSTALTLASVIAWFSSSHALPPPHFAPRSRTCRMWLISMPVAAAQLVLLTAAEDATLVGDEGFASVLPLAASGPGEPFVTAAGVLGEPCATGVLGKVYHACRAAGTSGCCPGCSLFARHSCSCDCAHSLTRASACCAPVYRLPLTSTFEFMLLSPQASCASGAPSLPSTSTSGASEGWGPRAATAAKTWSTLPTR